MTTAAIEANCDGLIGPTHSYAGLSPGNLAATLNAGAVSNPREAALEGLAKMRQVASLGLPQFVLPPQERPAVGFLRRLGFAGSDAEVVARAWRDFPAAASAASSASSMWAANAATVTASIDALDRRLHLTPANLSANLHRSLEAEQTGRALRRLFPDARRYVVHDPLPSVTAFCDEGAANHSRLCADHGAPGVDLFVYGREAWDAWDARFPARQTLEASMALARRHGVQRPVFARQSRAAIEAGAFHNDVVCVGSRSTLLFHEAAFADPDGVIEGLRRAADGLFTPEFIVISDRDLPLADAVSSYLFNSQLLSAAGEARLTLLAPVETRENPRARQAAEALAASNGPIGQILYANVRQSMRNGGGPACLRLRVVLTEHELAGVNAFQRLNDGLYARLKAWIERWHRDRLAPADLADPLLLDESRQALDQLTATLNLGGDFYLFQRA